MTRTALESIGQCGFGYSFEPLTEDGVPHQFSTAAKLFSYAIYFTIIGFMLLTIIQDQLYPRL